MPATTLFGDACGAIAVRPLLRVADPEARLRELRAEREPLYLETAQSSSWRGGLPFDRLVDEIVRRVARTRIGR